MVPEKKQSNSTKLYSLSELADNFSIDKDAIRFYENKKLLFPGKKQAVGHCYSEFDKLRLNFIVNAKKANYAIGDIESLIGKIDTEGPEEIQVKELVKYAETKYNEIEQSLGDMDMLEQINITCDMELLARYLTDVNTLKSRAAVNEFSRLKLIVGKQKSKPVTQSTHDHSIQGKAVEPIEFDLDSNPAKRQSRGLYIAIAVIPIFAFIIYSLIFGDFHPYLWFKTVVKHKQLENIVIQPKASPPPANLIAEKPIHSESSKIQDSQIEYKPTNELAGDRVSGRRKANLPFDPMQETVMERNKDIFAKVYQDLGDEDLSNTASTKKPSEMNGSLKPDSETKTLPQNQSQTTKIDQKETQQSAAMAAFMKKITEPSNQPGSVAPDVTTVTKPTSETTTKDIKSTKSIKKTINQKQPVADNAKIAKPTQTQPATETLAQKKPAQTKPAQKQPELEKRSMQITNNNKQIESVKSPVIVTPPSILPKISSGDTSASLEPDLKLQASKGKTDKPPVPKTKSAVKPTNLPATPKAVQADLPIDLLDENGVRSEKKASPKKPSPQALPWIQKSYNHVVKGEAGDAIVAATVAISFDPHIESPYINRAWAYSKKGDHDKAIQDCDKALRINPNSALALNNRGLAYQGKGDLDQAEQDYEKACKLGLDVACRNYQEITSGDKVSRLLNQINNSHLQEDWDAVIRFSTKALSQSPGNVDVYNHRAAAYIQKGFFYKAIKDCNDAIKIDPANAESFFNRGNALKQIGNLKVAVMDFKKSCDLGHDLGCQNHKEVKSKI